MSVHQMGVVKYGQTDHIIPPFLWLKLTYKQFVHNNINVLFTLHLSIRSSTPEQIVT